MRQFMVTAFAALAFLAAPVSAHAGEPEPYPQVDIPTSCNVSVPTAVAGQRVVLRVVVSASTNLPVTGSVDIKITKGTATARTARVAPVTVWTKTVRYEDSPLRVVGPRLSRGDHIASVRFTPDANTFIGCDDMAPFDVGGIRDDGDVGGEGDLPETGGPHFLLLIAGAVLVLAGAERVAASRRSRA